MLVQTQHYTFKRGNFTVRMLYLNESSLTKSVHLMKMINDLLRATVINLGCTNIFSTCSRIVNYEFFTV
jgi:hypothetical protein